MRNLAVICLSITLTVCSAQRPQYAPSRRANSPGEQSVTIEQLEQAITTSAKGVSDEALSYQIDLLEPAERLSQERLRRLEHQIHGRQSRESLMVFADRSEFAPPPASEQLSLPAPSLDEQKKMINRTADFVINTLHHMPDFYATRTTITFGRNIKAEQGMQWVGKAKDTVNYRNGDEEISAKHKSKVQGLTTRGEFGPILALSLLDAAKGHISWKRWEQGAEGQRAVYGYLVDAANSHYEVNGKAAAYRGEITVNPDSGVIKRLVLQSETEPGQHAKTDEVAVEYGPVDFAGKTYDCPQRSVALSRNDQLIWINDVVFNNYHLFHSDSHIVSDGSATR